MPQYLVWTKKNVVPWTAPVRIFDTPVSIFESTRLHIPVDGNFHQHRCESHISLPLRTVPNEQFIPDSVQMYQVSNSELLLYNVISVMLYVRDGQTDREERIENYRSQHVAPSSTVHSCVKGTRVTCIRVWVRWDLADWRRTKTSVGRNSCPSLVPPPAPSGSCSSLPSGLLCSPLCSGIYMWMPAPTQRLNGLELPGIMKWQDISEQASGNFEGNAALISSMWYSFWLCMLYVVITI